MGGGPVLHRHPRPVPPQSALLQSLALWTGVFQNRPAPADMAGMLAAAPHELLLTNLGALPIGTSYGSLTLKSLWGPSVLFGFEESRPSA